MGKEPVDASREQLSQSLKRLGLVTALALVTLGAVAEPGDAINVCRGIKRCVPVEGPWVQVRSGHEADFLLTCPKSGVVAGIDAAATTAAVRLSFDGRLGTPVSAGITTTSSAFFRAILVRGRAALFQPWLGCLIVAGNGRSTVSLRRASLTPGASLDRRAHVVRLRPGHTNTASIACPADEKLVGGWDTAAFYLKKAPDPYTAAQVHATRPAIRGNKVIARATANDALPADAHALIQLGASCAP